MTRILTKPPNDKVMWRRLKARVHPDAGGSHEDFIWVSHLEELVCSGLPKAEHVTQSSRRHQPEPSSTDNKPRVKFSPGHDFEELTNHALRVAHANEHSVYSYLLSLLADCRSLPHMHAEEQRGASYRRLAAIGHSVDMDLEERREWYALADSFPLSDRHAGHILGQLKKQAA